MKKIKIYSLIFVIFLFSCSKTKIVKEISNDPDIYYKKHYKEDKLSLIETYYRENLQSVYYLHSLNGIREDTLVYYELNNSIESQAGFFSDNKMFYYVKKKPNGTKISEGNMYKFRYNGWWKMYDENGKFTHEKYIIAKDSANYNYSQIKVYDSSGKIVPNKSDYISVFLPDTLYTGKSMGTLIHHPRLKDQLAYYVGVGYKVLPDFSNIMNVRVDTFTIKKDKTIGVEFKTPGKTKIRGFVYESAIEMVNDLEFNVVSVHTYFEKDFYVIPRPDSIPINKVMHYDQF